MIRNLTLNPDQTILVESILNTPGFTGFLQWFVFFVFRSDDFRLCFDNRKQKQVKAERLPKKHPFKIYTLIIQIVLD
ncbi:hypothetical protein DERP_008189 [Dermatophagoides pteronyssinus]|uniref:Uncharacterized protein n=1 Tax=Dermatophagoides pteronyssinus TaxID=6956 RepID=A0ABQ8JJZ1_DERPT|nr:hypothetical protein DERP_008189 [Dermatophagoides pteronyssinus]